MINDITLQIKQLLTYNSSDINNTMLLHYQTIYMAFRMLELPENWLYLKLAGLQ